MQSDTAPVDRVTEPPVAAAPRRSPLAPAGRVLGELLVTVGLVLLLFVVYELYVTDLLAANRQDALGSELQQRWSDPGASGADPADVPVGEAFAVLRIPRLGADWSRVVLEGAGQEQLAEGPGHYVGTAMPGQAGNVSIAGHRVGKGSPFLDLDRLRPGDAIVLETAHSWFTYRVLGDPATGDFADPSGIPGQEIVRPADVRVIAPTPNAPGAPADGSYLTLTTCHPKFSARQRLVVHAVQEGAPLDRATSPDGPPALAGG